MIVEDTLILIWQAQQAAEHGDKVTARNLLRQALHLDPNNGLAWEWMARLAAEPEQRRYCLERLLTLEPKNPFGLEQQLRENYAPLPPANDAEQTREMTMQAEIAPALARDAAPQVQSAALIEEKPIIPQQPDQPRNNTVRQVPASSTPKAAIKKNPAAERFMSIVAWMIVLLMLAGVLAFMAYQYFPGWFIHGMDTSLFLPFMHLV